jgi:CPA2 family monovalent cation:H+ antiporter-2
MDIKLIPLFIIPALVFLGVTSAAKFIIVFLSSKYQGFSKYTSIQTGLGLSSTRGGEMSLIVAKGGIDVGVVSPYILSIVGTITIISTFLSPYIIKFGRKLASKSDGKSI